ncbi:MAG TPA: N-acetylmuramoyl-L-alanine amidase [Bryobacteraceae bacterium]|nr:N-acetylmuramoyl-L-alanine amidase [Bryobacteraceae bacterium]
MRRLLALTAGFITVLHRTSMRERMRRAASVLIVLPAIAAANSGLIQVTGVRAWSHPDSTRVIVTTTGEFNVHSERAYNPDRLFFDLDHARPWIAGRRYSTQAIGDKLVKRIRIGEKAPGKTRIVFDLTGPTVFKVMRLDSPHRLVIEIRAGHSTPAPIPSVTRSLPSPVVAVPAAREVSSVARSFTPPPPAPYIRPLFPSATFAYPPASNLARRTRFTVYAQNVPSFDPVPLRAPWMPDPALQLALLKPPRVVRTVAPQHVASSRVVAPPKPLTYEGPARPSENAARSLTRALGLKVNRIVIDAGHGGHDDGTIGPHGVLEKDVVLDVALRLSKLVQSRMGAEVVLTRSDDTFIPLRERTAIANEHRADLFLSIHANSSPAPAVAGTETFFLNFTTSPGALDVAARENAGSDKTVGELKDLVQSIAQNDKIAESETFAQSVQGAIFAQSARSNGAARNRGVKRAPFVVLIGASMPSVLAEIGFLSNARDESNLGKAEYRQKIAEALYKGLSQYAQSLSHFEVAASQSGKAAMN